MGSKDKGVRIGPEDIAGLLSRKSNLSYKEIVSIYAREYQKLGWVLVALHAQDGTGLKVDFGDRPEIWNNPLWDSGLTGTNINLGVRTGRRSRLMVLEVTKGQGESILDRCGAWRAECIAALGVGREQHFYAWQPSPPFDSVSFWATPDFSWFGAGQIVPAPPSFDPETRQSWRWLCPPWQKLPQYPSQSLCQFLRQQITREPEAPAAVNLPWQEIYCLVSPHETVLQALFTPSRSMEDYYYELLEAARKVGINAPEVLLSLLWHAPQGDARRNLARWDYLQKLVAAAQVQPGAVPVRENDPVELILERAISSVNDNPGGCAGDPPPKPGPPCSLKRPRTRPPQPGGNPRAPLSNRKTGRVSKED
jgi:hypothetical protein